MRDVVVVVAGHDAYASAWPAMTHGIGKYLAVDWPIYWITNRLGAPKGCKTVKVGGDFNPKHWSDRIIRGLKQIPAKTILFMLDDHWLSGPVDLGALRDFAKLVQDDKVARLRLYPGWDHDRSSGVFEHDKRLLVMGKKSPYRTSCKPSFWNRDVFLSLLRNGESPWDFERDGRKRSAKHIFLAVKDWGYFPFVTKGDPSGDWEKSPLVKGRWTTSARDFCIYENLEIDLSKHPVETNPFGDDIPSYILS